MAGSATGRLQLGGWEAEGKRGNPSTQEGGPTGRCRVRPLGSSARETAVGRETERKAPARPSEEDEAGPLTSSTVEAMVGPRQGRPQLQRRRSENRKRRTDRAHPERRPHRHQSQWPRPASTPDPARDLGPPPARDASGTFASPSRPPPEPKHRLQGSAPPRLAWPRPPRLLATLNSRDQTGSSRREMPLPPRPGNCT